MTMGEAVTRVLAKYATFSGRAQRKEYWYYMLAYFLVLMTINILTSAFTRSTFAETSPIEWIVLLALFMPTLAVSVRRLHDTGRTGWWILLSLIPFVNIIGIFVLLFFYAQDSQPRHNVYGPNPKASSSSLSGVTSS